MRTLCASRSRLIFLRRPRARRRGRGRRRRRGGLSLSTPRGSSAWSEKRAGSVPKLCLKGEYSGAFEDFSSRTWAGSSPTSRVFFDRALDWFGLERSPLCRAFLGGAARLRRPRWPTALARRQGQLRRRFFQVQRRASWAARREPVRAKRCLLLSPFLRILFLERKQLFLFRENEGRKRVIFALRLVWRRERM